MDELLGRLIEQAWHELRTRRLHAADSPAPDIRATCPRGVVTVVTGMRGAGKTHRLWSRMEQLVAAGVEPERICYVDAADLRLRACGALDPGALLDVFFARSPAAKEQASFFFIDEPATVGPWLACAARAADVYDIRLTLGVCDADIAEGAVPGDAACDLRVQPLAPRGFTEYVRAFRRGVSAGEEPLPKELLGRYMAEGGLPASRGLAPRARDALLQGYVRESLNLGLYERGCAQDSSVGMACAARALARTDGRLSATDLVKTLGDAGIATTRATVARVVEEMRRRQLVHLVRELDHALDANPRSAPTVYAADHALCASVGACGRPTPLQVARTMVFAKLGRAEVPGGVYTCRARLAASADFALGNPRMRDVGLLVSVTQGRPGDRAFALAAKRLAAACERFGCERATLVTLYSEQDAAPASAAVPPGIDVVPLVAWLMDGVE